MTEENNTLHRRSREKETQSLPGIIHGDVTITFI
jgi:hypothetical protein